MDLSNPPNNNEETSQDILVCNDIKEVEEACECARRFIINDTITEISLCGMYN